METMECLIDGHHGIYVPQVFAESYNPETWTGVMFREILKQGPDHKDYWDAWDYTLNEAVHTDENGQKWTLYHGESGDLFIVHESHEWGE